MRTGCGVRATSTSTASFARPAASNARARRSRTRRNWLRGSIGRAGARRVCRRWPSSWRRGRSAFRGIHGPRRPTRSGFATTCCRCCRSVARFRWTSCAERICATSKTRSCGAGWPRARSTARSRRCRRCCVTLSISSSSTPTRPRGLRVRPADPRLDPRRGPVQRRAVPPGEIRAFIAQVSPSQRGRCWAPVMTGCRPGELLAMHADEIDNETQTIYLHETVDRYGRLMRGLKGSHHVGDREKRGRCFPHSSATWSRQPTMATCSARRAESSGRSGTSTATSGRQRRSARACRSRSTTCATRSRPGCWRPGFPWSRSQRGWGTRSAPAAKTGEHREQALSVLTELFAIGPSASSGDRA